MGYLSSNEEVRCALYDKRFHCFSLLKILIVVSICDKDVSYFISNQRKQINAVRSLTCAKKQTLLYEHKSSGPK